MLNNSNIPFNIYLLIPDDSFKTKFRAVSSLDTYDVSSKNFHPDGLYSVETFGIVGTPARDARYGYIDLKIKILHPVIYNTLIQLRSFYKDIISAKEFAVWNDELKDFEKSNAIEGNTGYEFFISKFKQIVFEPRQSVKREQALALLAKYKNNCMLDKVLVIPAGYRDMEVDGNGRAGSDEINSLYYKLIAVSNTINNNTSVIVPESYNSQRVSLQNTFNQIYDYINTIIDGKDNLMMGKWASRKIFNGTRNVITAQDTIIEDINDPNALTINDTSIGLYQTLKAMLPVTLYNLKTKFLSTVFTAVGTPALLTNKKTFLSERVDISNLESDRWMTNEGIEKQVTYFRENTIRHNEIKVDNHYLGLVYRGPDGTFKLIHGIDELPEGRSKDDCSPITYAELFYSSIYDIANSYPLLVTRYPITGVGSVYTSMTYLKSTIEFEIRRELGDDWKPMGDDKIAKQFPVKGSEFFNSVSPSPSKLSGLGGDGK
jgi:hypothetical protein